MWVLLAVAVVVVGFALRINSMLVVTVSGITAGAIAGLNPIKIIEEFGTGFAGSRSVTVFIVVLPVIGLIERYGLQDQARKLIEKLRGYDDRAAARRLPVHQADHRCTRPQRDRWTRPGGAADRRADVGGGRRAQARQARSSR